MALRYTSSGLSLTQEAVEQVIKRSKSAFSSPDSRNENGLLVLADRATVLKDFRDSVLEIEKKFFKMLNVEDYDNPQAAIINLQKRIDEIDNEHGLKKLVDNGKYEILSHLSDYLTQLSTDTIIQEMNDNLDLILEANKSEVEDYFEKVIMGLNSLLSRDNSKQHFVKGKKIKNSEVTEAYGLARYVFIVEINGKPSIQLKESEGKLPPEMKRKIDKAIKLGKGTYNQTKEREFKEVLKDEIKKLINSEKVKPYLDYRFEQVYNKYGISQNENAIIGFLGELRNDIILDMLMNKVGATAPTGNIKSLIEGQSLNIDSVLNGFGFQVKNYTISSEGVVSFSHSMQAGNFIKDRARTDLEDLLIELFGTYQFNQVFATDAEEGHPGSYPQTYEELEKLLYDTEGYFQGYIDNIIKMSDEFSARFNDLKLFRKNKLYFNTFFMISNKLVPSSAILNAIIKSLSEANDEIKFSFEYITPSQDINTLEQIILLGGRNLTKSSYSIEGMANLVTIKYNVDLSLNKILESAYNWI